jgi:MFS transporter, DHA3 family, multidrug efflux protein
MKAFHAVVANTVAAMMINTVVWFAITFWVYLQTGSVVATSIMAGIFTTTIAISGFYLGSLVDRFPKKQVMMLSSFGSLALYALALMIFVAIPAARFRELFSVHLWLFIGLALIGALMGNLRGIALSTLVTLMVPETDRDRANGLVGTANGVAFLVASIVSGLVIGFAGVAWLLIGACTLTLLVIAHLTCLTIADRPSTSAEEATLTQPAPENSGIDIGGTISAIQRVPGLFGLIFFHTFNNFLGGVFMSLMDAYGLSLVSVQVWGTIFGLVSLGFIIGGLVVAKKGLGTNPLFTLFLANIAIWLVCCVFTLQAAIELLSVGLFIWMCLIPVIEAAEQTILQKVVPVERQGRVFGFAQSVEQAASPITAFLIGPIAQWLFIPYMTTGAGVALLGPWFGSGADRGLALLFTVTGLIGLVGTLLAMRTQTYRLLAQNYRPEEPANEQGLVAVYSA